MPWIFGSFLVTPCALTSCHVISKQGSTIRALGYNRCVTGRRAHDENHVGRFRQSAKNRSRTWDTQLIRLSLTSLQGGASIGTPWLPVEDMGRRSPFSEYIYLSTHLSHTTETSTLSRIKCEGYIFIKKCVCSFIEVRKLCLIMFPLIFVLQLYNTGVNKDVENPTNSLCPFIRTEMDMETKINPKKSQIEHQRIQPDRF